MPTHKLTNYLRVHRKRAGLTQREAAFLLGLKARGPISELEKRHRLPLLRTALALEVIFGVSASELFAGIRESLTSEIGERLQKLACELTPKVGKRKTSEYHLARKLAWLQARQGSTIVDDPQNSRPASPRS